MSLHYIIDGYNVIKSGEAGLLSRGALEEQRNHLLSLIRDTRPQGSTRNRVTVVFDGPFISPFPGEMPGRVAWGIEVVFSEGKTADERIEEMVHGSALPAEIVVVTDDRGIHRMLGGSGVRFMPVNEFMGRTRRHCRETGEAGADCQTVLDIEQELRRKWLK